MNAKMNAGSIWYSAAKDAYLELIAVYAECVTYRFAGEDNQRTVMRNEFLRNFSRV